MRRVLIHYSTNTSVVVVIIVAMAVWPVSSSQEAAGRCQKSGCRIEGADELPALIVAKSSPSSAKVLPIIISWMTAFFCLRLAAHYLRKLLPMIRERIPEIRTAAGHYYDSMVSNGGSFRRGNSGQRRRRSQTSNVSLGSLADLIDDSGRSGRGASLWYDNDSSCAGNVSAYSSNYNSEGDEETAEYGMAAASQSQQSDMGLSMLSSSEYYRSHSARRLTTKADHSVASSTSYSTYNYYNDTNDDDLSRGADSIVSKFLNYISVSKPPTDTPRKNRGGGYDGTKRRPSLDYNNLRHTNNNTDTESNNQRRRSTIDEMEYPSYLSHQQFSTAHGSSPRRESSNATEPLLVTQTTKPSGGGVKMRKAAAAATNSQYHGDIKNSGKTKTSTLLQTTTQQQQQPIQYHDKEEDKKKKTSLQHHLSKFSSTTKDDDENYSTMLSTVDLRTRATRDTRATKDSKSFFGK